MDLPPLSRTGVEPKPLKTLWAAACCSFLLIAGLIHAAAVDGKTDGKLDYNLEDYLYFPYTYQSLEFYPSINAWGDFNRGNDTSAVPKQDYFNNAYRLGWGHVFNKNTRRIQVSSRFNGAVQYYQYASDYTYKDPNDPLYRYQSYGSSTQFGMDISGKHVFNWYTTPEIFLNTSLVHSFSLFNPQNGVSEDIGSYSNGGGMVGKSYHGQVVHERTAAWAPLLNICIGKGRISDVTFPAVAIELLERLSRMNVLDKEINSNDIVGVAHLFEKLKNTRLFDYRLKRIADVKEICSFLNTDSLCKQIAPETVMELLDYLEYAFTQARSAGRTISLGVMTGGYLYFNSGTITYYSENRLQPQSDPFEYSKGYYKSLPPYNDTSIDVFNLTNYKYGLIASIERRKPIKLSGQINAHLAVSGGMKVNRRSDAYRSLFGDIDGNIEYVWFPNLRSTVSNALTLNYSKSYWNSRALNRNNFRENLDNVQLYYNPSIHYYLNPRLEYNIYGSVYFTSRNDEYFKFNDHDFGYSLGCSMNYKFY